MSATYNVEIHMCDGTLHGFKHVESPRVADFEQSLKTGRSFAALIATPTSMILKTALIDHVVIVKEGE